MKKKGTPALLALMIVAGIGLYCAYANNDIAPLPVVTTVSTLAELWTGPGEHPWRATRPADQATRTARTTRVRRGTVPATTAAETTTATPPANPDSSYVYAQEYGLYPGEAKIPIDKYLICVNRERALPARYNVSLAVCVENVYPENRMMERQAARQYKKMYDAALRDDAELIPFSAYRSVEQQKAAFDREVDTLEVNGLGRQDAIERVLETVQLPGCSEHETGLAVDITRKGVWNTDPGFAESKEFEWLTAHAQDYGFILRYPRGKQALTGVSYEPWHWRYVGATAAAEMKKSGQCLEEYLGLG